MRRRGRLIGDKPLTDEWVRKYGWSSIDEFALAYIVGEVDRLACPEDKPWPRSGNKVLCIPGLKPSSGFTHRRVVLGVLRRGLMRVVTWVIGVLPLMS